MNVQAHVNPFSGISDSVSSLSRSTHSQKLGDRWNVHLGEGAVMEVSDQAFSIVTILSDTTIPSYARLPMMAKHQSSALDILKGYYERAISS